MTKLRRGRDIWTRIQITNLYWEINAVAGSDFWLFLVVSSPLECSVHSALVSFIYATVVEDEPTCYWHSLSLAKPIFYFLSSKLLSLDQPRQHIKKQRHYFANEGPSSQSYSFPSSHVWIWELAYIKIAERRIIEAFELWCRRRFLSVPWTVRRSNQSILKEISPEYSLKDWCWSWNSTTLATWCKELTQWKGPWCWERLKAGGQEDYRGWDGWMASLSQWTWIWVNSGSWRWTGRPGMLQPMGSQRVGHNWMTELNWTEVTRIIRGTKALVMSSREK